MVRRADRPDRAGLHRTGAIAVDDANDVDALLAGYPVTITIPVQWGEQDPFGHVNNVIYFRWFESARIAYFRRIGIMKHLTPAPLGAILAGASCQYRRSIVYPDTVRVGVRATGVGLTSIAFEQRIVSLEHRALAAEGTATAVVYDYEAGRPQRVPDDIRQAIAELEGWRNGEGEGPVSPRAGDGS
jgi:acyl-CoA thioester hydrolase